MAILIVQGVQEIHTHSLQKVSHVGSIPAILVFIETRQGVSGVIRPTVGRGIV